MWRVSFLGILLHKNRPPQRYVGINEQVNMEIEQCLGRDETKLLLYVTVDNVQK